MIGIIDYGVGNIGSLAHAFVRLGIPARLIRDPKDIQGIKKLILPGVGHAGTGMKNLTERGFVEPIRSATEKGIPLLGICLGMQLLGLHSEEGETDCLGLISADIVEFDNSRSEDKILARVPHMGWNTLEVKKQSPLLEGIAPDDEFYFAHSYFLKPKNDASVTAMTSYFVDFPSVISEKNIFGVQFHPEKSRDAGARILKNFSAL